jgi:hypothetical protein
VDNTNCTFDCSRVGLENYRKLHPVGGALLCASLADIEHGGGVGEAARQRWSCVFMNDVLHVAA